MIQFYYLTLRSCEFVQRKVTLVRFLMRERERGGKEWERDGKCFLKMRDRFPHTLITSLFKNFIPLLPLYAISLLYFICMSLMVRKYSNLTSIGVESICLVVILCAQFLVSVIRRDWVGDYWRHPCASGPVHIGNVRPGYLLDLLEVALIHNHGWIE